MDLRLFRIREFAAGNIAQLLNALAWLGMMLLISFYMQIVLDFSPKQTGMGLLPLEFVFVIVGPLSGALSDKYGPRLFATAGLALSSAALFWLSGVTLSTAYMDMVVPLVLLGIGSGMFVSPNISSIMRSVPPNRRGVASAFRTTMFNVGGTASAGLAILLITTAIPYDTFSNLLRSPDPRAFGEMPEQAFVNGFRSAAFVLACINTLAIIPSLMRGAGANRNNA